MSIPKTRNFCSGINTGEEIEGVLSYSFAWSSGINIFVCDLPAPAVRFSTCYIGHWKNAGAAGQPGKKNSLPRHPGTPPKINLRPAWVPFIPFAHVIHHIEIFPWKNSPPLLRKYLLYRKLFASKFLGSLKNVI